MVVAGFRWTAEKAAWTKPLEEVPPPPTPHPPEGAYLGVPSPGARLVESVPKPLVLKVAPRGGIPLQIPRPEL